jgi:hypothetical protein
VFAREQGTFCLWIYAEALDRVIPEIKNFRGRKTTVTMRKEMEELHQLLLTIVLPELNEIKSRIDNLEKMHNHLNRRCDRVEADLCEFYRVLGSYEAKIDRLEKAGNQRD